MKFNDLMLTPTYRILQCIFNEIRGRKIEDYYHSLLLRTVKVDISSLLNNLIIENKVSFDIIDLIKMDFIQEMSPENIKVYKLVINEKCIRINW